MSSKMYDLYRDNWEIYWDVNEPTLTITAPGYFENPEEDSVFTIPELVMTMEEVLKLEESIQNMKKYWKDRK